MSSAIVKLFLAAIAAGSVAALPQPMEHGHRWGSTATSSSFVPAPTVDNTALIIELETAPTAIDRFQKLLLGADGKIKPEEELQKVTVFDFNTAGTPSAGGRAAAANVANFPILTKLGISTTMGFLGACGMNTPHIHPRATEFLTLVDGEIDFGYILENGLVDPKVSTANEITGHLTKNMGTVFPMGSIHYQVNTECHPATFVATLNSEDAGTSQIAQNFFGLNTGVVNATLGFPESLNGADIEKFRSQIPANLALGIDKCLAKCGIPKN
jgi:hypothetical protein